MNTTNQDHAELPEQERVRREKRQYLLSKGIDPYGMAFPDRESIRDLKARLLPWTQEGQDKDFLPETPVKSRIAGRIVLLRRFGKAFFATLQDNGDRFQIYVKKDRLADGVFDLFNDTLDIGDHLGISGTFFKTKTGEPTLEASELWFLGKSVHPLPEKWHGLSDIETRYRQRYIDLIVNLPARQVFEDRSRILSLIRRFMDDRGFLEVETPMMHPSPGGALARPFVTHHNSLGTDLYLRIAPELYLKRLVVGGFTKVYEINRNFRNEGFSPRHNPEFTMMEFYMAYHSPEELMELTETLISELSRKIRQKTSVKFGDHEIELMGPYRRISYLGSLKDRFGLTEKELFSEEKLLECLDTAGIPVPPRRGGETLFCRPAKCPLRRNHRKRSDPANLRHRVSQSNFAIGPFFERQPRNH